ncbi:MAG: hypothetical protein HYY37_00695 [Candidatus Aenigmarchaeota archaeon]|nr:hypothetical protein [Candidatus Aenigmarchaeota archaeon]
MKRMGDVKSRLDKLEKEIGEVKRVLIRLGSRNKKKSKNAWKNLLQASDEISRKWSGHDAVEDIRRQRAK